MDIRVTFLEIEEQEFWIMMEGVLQSDLVWIFDIFLPLPACKKDFQVLNR